MRRACARLREVRRVVISTNRSGPSGDGEPFPFPGTIEAMRGLHAGAAALCLMAALTACSGSGNDTGSAGGWRVSGARIRTAHAQDCRTPAPVVDTFSSTPSPQPGCSPKPSNGGDAGASPDASAAPAAWDRVHTEDYHSATSGWHPIYTTYTAPPASGVYQPLVHATNQPMPTPFNTPTPAPAVTHTPLPTPPPMATQPPSFVQPSATP